VLIVAVLLVLAGINFMASVKSDLQTAASTITGILALIALVQAFKQVK